MAVEIGTASDTRDLMLKLEKFLTSNPDLVREKQAWTAVRDSGAWDKIATLDEINHFDRDGVNGWACRVRFIGHGLDGEDTIVVPMSLYINESAEVSSLCAWYASPNDADKEIAKHFAKINLLIPFTAIPLRNEPMSYWFVANGRRFIIVVKVREYYMSMYCGFMLQFGTDLENPYPMYLGGGHNNNYARILVPEDNEKPQSNIDYNYGGLHDPLADPDSFGALGGEGFGALSRNSSSCFCNTPDGNLAMMHMEFEELKPWIPGKPYSSGFLFPYAYTRAEDVAYDRTREGKYLLSPIEIFVIPHNDSDVGSTVGWLHGAYFVSGKENTAEKELNIGNKRYLCFPSMTNKPNSWFALLME